MDTAHERLAEARKQAGYATAADAAVAMGVAGPTYTHHENGTRGLSRVAPRYARFFGVSLDWLLTGRGEMRARPEAAWEIDIDGMVGAGASVEMFDDLDHQGIGSVTLSPAHLGAMIVRGESQWPRFLDGEVVLYDRRPVSPSTLIGRFAVVQDLNGGRLIKIIRRGTAEGLYTLESHNAPPVRDIRLLAAWPYVGVLATR